MICIDIETCSAADIRNGAWPYAEHPSTRVHCVVLAQFRKCIENVCEWTPGNPLPDWAVRGLQQELVVAHNAMFEAAILTHVLRDWPCPDPGQWVDTALLAAAANLPVALEGLAAAVGATVQKDLEGQRLMRRLAKVAVLPNGAFVHPTPTPEELRQLVSYCRKDVEATIDCLGRLPKLTATELQVVAEDRRINLRGVWLDQQQVARMLRLTGRRQEQLADAAFEATDAQLADALHTPRLKAWIEAQGVELPTVKRANGKTSSSVDRSSAKQLLRMEDLPPHVRHVLLARTEATKATSLAKLQKVQHVVNSDGRLRGALRYCGAHTGRWTGSGLQLHNMPRIAMKDHDRDLAAMLIESEDVESFKMGWERPLDVLSMMLRTIVAAPPGKDLIGADYAAIEARVVAWLAGQDNVIEALHAYDAAARRGEKKQDLYEYTAEMIGSTDRQLGKIAVLALGYGMGAIKFSATAAVAGITLPLKEARRIQKLWRAANANIASFWRGLEDAAMDAIRHPGRTFTAGDHLQCASNGNCLMIRLPSGRLLRYWRPSLKQCTKVVQTVDDDGKVFDGEITGEEIRFFAPGKDARSMAPESAYGGKLVENVTQAVARDVLAEALLRLRNTCYDVVLHVHDSIVAEVPEGVGSVDKFVGLLVECPEWATGLPLAAKGYRSRRFQG